MEGGITILTENEKEAIEQFKRWREYIIKHREETNQANDLEFYIRTVLNLITKLQKENEELKSDNLEKERVLEIFDNRKYRKRYLKERRKEEPNLLYPDGDEIYKRYYELKKQIDLMAEYMFNKNKAQLIIEYGIENKEQLIKEFEKQAKEEGNKL